MNGPLSLLTAAVASTAFVALAAATGKAASAATPVAGAIAALVALMLPAAELAGGYISRRLPELIKSYADGQLATMEDVELARSALNRTRQAVAPARRGFHYLIFAFPVSLIPLFQPRSELLGLRIESLLIGLAVGFGVTGVFLFLPLIRALLSLDLFRPVERMVTMAERRIAAQKEAPDINVGVASVAPVKAKDSPPGSSASG